MTENDAAVQNQARRPFAAKYEHRKGGIAAAVVGGLALIGGLGAIGDPESNPASSIIVGLVLVAWSVYLLRGRGVDPRVTQRRAEAEQRRAATAAAGMEQATATLAAAGAGGAALVAYRNLEATAQRFHPTEAAAKVEAALQEIGFDRGTLSSPRYGYIASADGGSVEIFQDWVIFGQEAHDVDAATRGRVYVDGSVQVTSTVVLDKKYRQQVVNQQHDMRTAQLQLTGAGWSMSVPIAPDAANEARMLVDRLTDHVQSLGPKAATSADIRDMVSAILNSTGQPAAEKIRQLDHLRYERLLSDEEFKRAKGQILGLAP